jgi:hypothetical protein
MKARTHTLRDQATGGFWDFSDREFFATLREHPTEPAVKRVETVLTLMVEADTLAREQREQKRLLERSGKDWHRSKSFMDSLDASTHTCHLLNIALSRYRWMPLVWSGVGRLETKQRAVTVSTGKWAPWERGAVEVLFDLAGKPGELSRLRRCSECLQWFYAIKGHQQFCGVSCRRRHTAQDTEFKEKRATYMRETYRPLQKELAANSLARVRIGQREKSK